MKAQLINGGAFAIRTPSSIDELTASPLSGIVSVGATLEISAHGGVPPYSYQVLVGGGSINASSGLYQAPTTPGSATVQITDLRGVTQEASIVIQPGAPTQVLLSGATSLTAGDCSAYTVVQKDVYGNLANATPTATTINFTGSASSVFYSDSSCSTSVTSASIPANSSSTTIYLKDTKAETFTFTSSGTGLTSSSLSVTIQPGPPAKLALSGPTTVLVNGCSSAYTVKSTDIYGNTSALGSDSTITLSGAGSGAFYSDSSCATPVTSVDITSGSSTKNFYIKDSASEALTLLGSTPGLTDGSLAIGIKTQMVISGPASIEAGVCSLFTVTSKDATGAVFPVPVDSYASVYNPTSSGRYENVYSDATCTTMLGGSDTGYMWMLTGQSSVTFYAIIRRAGSTQHAIGATSSLSTGGPGFNFTVTPTTASKLIITGPSFVQPNTCSAPYTVTSLDTYDNISGVPSDTTIDLSSDGTGAGFYIDDTCTIPISDITLTSGTNGIQFYFMDSTSELVNLTAATASAFTWGSFLTSVTSTPPTILSALSGAHGCAIVNGAVKCWGAGGYLGNNSNSSSLVPVQAVGITSGATAIATSGMESLHTCAVVNGSAMCWGDGGYGALGTGSSLPKLTPAQVVGLTSGVTAIAVGGNSSCAVANGAAWCWGGNYDGQLGNNSTTNSNVPVAVQGLSSGVTAIATGGNYSCAVVNGAAKCWGGNNYGALGDGTGISSLVPVQVQGLTSGVTGIATGRSYSCAIVNGGVKCWGIGTGNTPITVGGLSGNVTSISIGEFTACAVDNGAAKCWADGTSPVATIVSGLSSGVQSVSVGTLRANSPTQCAVTSDGLHCWGINDRGQLGNGTTTNSLSTPLSFLSLN